ncbi:hypothetical protein MPDQ_000977 [Monascus purpureus]|uniref:Uncharacterized protein n=1 Tax=Monascus purpureus TaxID=5098 RepID=A0A507QQJ5_MONPU|nr:hypothetical protein MPDQ_000977 [Monascus purpureus]
MDKIFGLVTNFVCDSPYIQAFPLSPYKQQFARIVKFCLRKRLVLGRGQKYASTPGIMSTYHSPFLGLAELPYCKMLSFNSNSNVLQLPGQRKRLRLSDRALQIQAKSNYVNLTLPMEFSSSLMRMFW